MSGWDVVVDVSNVCRDPALPPPGARVAYSRVDRVVRAWRAEKEPSAGVLLVADKSLAHFLDDFDRRALAGLRDGGALLMADVADVVLLDLARRGGLHVLSRDHFVDHRAEHGWIEENPQRFHCWATDGGTETLSIVPRGIRTVSRQTSSQAREIKELRLQGLDPRRHRHILMRRWRCRNTDCTQSRVWQGELLLWPAVTAASRPLCPSCAVQLEDIGPRRSTRQVVVSDERTGVELLRFPLEIDVPLTVGRGAVDNGINLAGVDGIDPASAGRLSRAHLVLALDAAPGQLRCAATDLGSTNGTTHLRRAPGGFHEPVPLVPDETVMVDFHDRLVLAGVVRVEISGQRFIADPRPPDIDSTGDTGPTCVGAC